MSRNLPGYKITALSIPTALLCGKPKYFQCEELSSVADADPDPVPFLPLDPGFGMGRKSASGSGMSNPDHIF
jgi:hypothetical protein